ncbi:Oleosin 5 [Striga hermonthica]|uniref:Oleosin 5 n=1 Tax=Striga hermonthica TaxID=68872 RepID=A0A9N7REG9_STRHE|nr:Oleosin 5 [Striga hermonthica]
MAEHHQHHGEAATSHLSEKGPTTSQIVAVVCLVPVGGFLLTVAGLTLAGTLFGLAVSAPLFVIFSPVIVPAVLTFALAVAGFLTAGAFGVTALSSVIWLLNYLRRMREGTLEHMGQRVQDTAGRVGERTR